ncbi:hypothetical protein [Chryseobacterium lathyri]|uniref:Kazal-like domain-containing protein n=1 Tax=Chryseobacterium lathyri TaxID=395933 RepID=A0A511YFT3_9FLAO|nr:hypothetical protein [Chryseobacterium lathyri]GEN74067.1 hypothetical protein CLA01_41390 [Chryseobacterium lathyri]
MKKLILVAALGVAGLASAKGNVKKMDLKAVEWCGTVTYQTSCGFPIQDSYCTSWGQQCLMDNMALLDEYFCG